MTRIDLRFWDSSAIAPLLLPEKRSIELRTIYEADTAVAAAAITPVEIESLLWRRRHRGELSLFLHQRAETVFALMSERWLDIAHLPHITDIARDVLARHQLRSLDALQLASAVAARTDIGDLPFVTLDARLAAVARAEGFHVIP